MVAFLVIACAAAGVSAACTALALVARQGWKVVAFNALACTMNAAFAVYWAIQLHA